MANIKITPKKTSSYSNVLTAMKNKPVSSKLTTKNIQGGGNAKTNQVNPLKPSSATPPLVSTPTIKKESFFFPSAEESARRRLSVFGSESKLKATAIIGATAGGLIALPALFGVGATATATGAVASSSLKRDALLLGGGAVAGGLLLGKENKASNAPQTMTPTQTTTTTTTSNQTNTQIDRSNRNQYTYSIIKGSPQASLNTSPYLGGNTQTPTQTTPVYVAPIQTPTQSQQAQATGGGLDLTTLALIGAGLLLFSNRK